MRRTWTAALTASLLAVALLAPLSAGAVERKGGSYEVAFPTRLQDGPVKYVQDGHWVSFALEGARGRMEVKRQTALAEGAMRGVSVAFIAGHNALKEGLVLKSRSAPNVFRWRVRTSRGLTLVPDKEGVVRFVDRAGKPLFAFTDPFMFDSAAEPVTSHAVRVSLRKGRRANTWTYALRADRAWLADPARKFPVVVDPTIVNIRSWGCTGLPEARLCNGRPEDPIAVCSTTAYPGPCYNLLPVSGSNPADVEPVTVDLTCLIRLLLGCEGLPVYQQFDPPPGPDPGPTMPHCGLDDPRRPLCIPTTSESFVYQGTNPNDTSQLSRLCTVTIENAIPAAQDGSGRVQWRTRNVCDGQLRAVEIWSYLMDEQLNILGHGSYQRCHNYEVWWCGSGAMDSRGDISGLGPGVYTQVSHVRLALDERQPGDPWVVTPGMPPEDDAAGCKPGGYWVKCRHTLSSTITINP